MLRWYVSEKDPNVPSQAEAGGNAFVEDGEELLNPATNLVREAIQNSLDKRRESSGPVVVRFAIASLDAESLRTWVGDLLPHARVSWPQGLARAENRPRVLVVEDFNTQGLNGDVTATSLRDVQAGNDFFFFWRAQNISPKQGQGGGSWGVGKTTYYLLSHIGTILGLSVPSDARNPVTIMGRCHLTEHSLPDKSVVYQHFGYGCDPNMPNDLALPLQRPSEIAAFKSAWPITRSGEPGLSVVIPYLRTELEGHDVVRAVIEEYPFPIVSGELRVLVSDETGQTTTIDDATIAGLCEMLGLSAKAMKHLEMSRLLHSGTPHVTLPAQEPSSRPASDLAADVVDLARAALDGNGYVHIRVPLEIRREDSAGSVLASTDHIDVVLRESQEAQPFYVRSGLWVRGEPGQGVPRPTRLDSLLVLRRPRALSDPSVAELMGRFEGPSHRAWDAPLDQDRRPTRYHDAPKVRQYVRRLPAELSLAIAARAESERSTLAEDWFSTSATGTGGGGRRNASSPRVGVAITRPNLKGRPKITADLVARNRSKVRFHIEGSSAIPLLHVRLGYEQQDRGRTANLDSWSSNDFSLQLGGRRRRGFLKVSAAKGTKSYADSVKDNIVVCRDVEPASFGLVIEGVDVARGLQWEAMAWDSQGQPIPLGGSA